MLGPRGWKLYVTGLGRKPPLRFLLDSRLPIEVAKSRIVFGVGPQKLGNIYIIDPRGEPIWRINVKLPATLVLDYAGAVSSKLEGIRVSSLSANLLTYEAIAVIYDVGERVLAQRRRLVSPSLSGLDVRQAVYIARKLVEVLKFVDSYPFLDVAAIAYVLRNVLMDRGVLADMESASLEIDPVRPLYTYRVKLKLYKQRGLEAAGYAEVVADLANGVFTIQVEGKEVARMTVDVEAGKVCIMRELCVEAEGGGEQSLQGLEAMFGGAT